jgi:hypothetical protein
MCPDSTVEGQTSGTGLPVPDQNRISGTEAEQNIVDAYKLMFSKFVKDQINYRNLFTKKNCESKTKGGKNLLLPSAY